MHLALTQDKKTFRKDNIAYFDISEEKQFDGTQIKSLVRFIHASHFDGIKMTNLIVVDRSKGKINRIIFAKSAKLSSDKKGWDFSNGKIYTIYTTDVNSKKSNSTNFKYLKVILNKTPLDVATSDQVHSNSTLKKDNVAYNVTYFDTKINQDLLMFFYAHKFDNQQMETKDVIIVYFNKNKFKRLIEAKNGKRKVNYYKKKLWDFTEVQMYDYDFESNGLMTSTAEKLQIDFGGS